MTEDLKEEIKEILTNPTCRKLIKDGNWEEFYRFIRVRNTYSVVGAISYFLINNCNINPLDYMSVIPDGFMYDVEELTEFTIPNNIKRIGYATFFCTGLTNITVPKGIRTIDGRAFYGCSNLKSIAIPKSVKSMRMNVFYNCPSLKDVYYEGSKKDWDSINMGIDKESLSEAKIHYNS